MGAEYNSSSKRDDGFEEDLFNDESRSVYGSPDDESETESDGDECEMDFFDDECSDGSVDDIETESDDELYSNVSIDSGLSGDDDEGDVDDSCDEMDIDELSGAGPGYDSFPEDESETENEDDECEKNIFDEESSDDETVAEPVQFKDSPIAVPLNYVSGEYGQRRLMKTESPENLHSVPYPVFYRYRGKALRDLNRLEYYSLVQVKRRDK